MESELENEVSNTLDELGYLGFKFDSSDSGIVVKALVKKPANINDLMFKTKLSLDGYLSRELFEFYEYVYLNQEDDYTEVKFIYKIL
jgi:hypothetical protein